VGEIKSTPKVRQQNEKISKGTLKFEEKGCGRYLGHNNKKLVIGTGMRGNCG